LFYLFNYLILFGVYITMSSDLSSLITKDYQYKYRKYKNKYKALTGGINNSRLIPAFEFNLPLNSTGGSVDDYYFIHGVLNIKNLYKILETGKLTAGKNVPNMRNLSGWELLDYIYCLIYFDDLKNLPVAWGVATIILHPKILNKYGAIFNKGWSVHPTEDSIIINKEDDNIDTKLKEIKDYLKNYKSPSEFEMPEIMQQEVLFKEDIPLDNNILAIVCTNCSNHVMKKIKKIIKGKPYSNVKILTNNILPKLDDLL